MIGASAAGNPLRAGELLEQIAESRPTGDMFPVACGVASVGRDLMVRAVGGIVPAGMLWAPRPVPQEDEKIAFARRFLAAWANGDTDMCRALYQAQASLPGYALADAVIALVIYVGKMVNDQLDGSVN